MLVDLVFNNKVCDQNFLIFIDADMGNSYQIKDIYKDRANFLSKSCAMNC